MLPLTSYPHILGCLVFNPTLAYWNFAIRYRLSRPMPYIHQSVKRVGTTYTKDALCSLECSHKLAYVDSFDRICHELGLSARNHSLIKGQPFILMSRAAITRQLKTNSRSLGKSGRVAPESNRLFPGYEPSVNSVSLARNI